MVNQSLYPYFILRNLLIPVSYILYVFLFAYLSQVDVGDNKVQQYNGYPGESESEIVAKGYAAKVALHKLKLIEEKVKLIKPITTTDTNIINDRISKVSMILLLNKMCFFIITSCFSSLTPSIICRTEITITSHVSHCNHLFIIHGVLKSTLQF